MVNRLTVVFLTVSILFSCDTQDAVLNKNPENKIQAKGDTVNAFLEDATVVKKQKDTSAIEKTMIKAGLVNVQEVDSTLLVEVRYATTNNFMGEILYENYHKVYLQPEVAQRLSNAQKALKKIDSTLTLKVFDGARPRSVQTMMWEAMDTLPIRERTKFLSNPKHGSIHNFGCAVDLTIVHKKSKKPLDMGAGYDDLRKIAYPRLEQQFLASGELTQQQVNNRKLLRKVMRIGGFYNITTEWWHFNAFNRSTAKKRYDIIE